MRTSTLRWSRAMPCTPRTGARIGTSTIIGSMPVIRMISTLDGAAALQARLELFDRTATVLGNDGGDDGERSAADCRHDRHRGGDAEDRQQHRKQIGPDDPAEEPRPDRLHRRLA